MPSLYVMTRSFLKHLISIACILLSNSALNVQDSHAYKNIDMTSERISLIFELRTIFLSFQMVLSFSSVCVILNSLCPIFHKHILAGLRLVNRGNSRSGVRICYTGVFIDKITVEWENSNFHTQPPPPKKFPDPQSLYEKYNFVIL